MTRKKKEVVGFHKKRTLLLAIVPVSARIGNMNPVVDPKKLEIQESRTARKTRKFWYISFGNSG
ncbi:hypothetical protein [Gimesia chilikensis]|uniref:hypothetical protein n=1 Tax=Gimesia chilikensis TaxID=2605989 RepID=UPI0011A608E4|nr:hypothetical protein [Gimesia chilikensis]